MPILAVHESAVSASAINSRAPEGIGEHKIPIMVATKMANICQACGVNPSGHGNSQIPTRRNKGMAHRKVGTFFHHIIELREVSRAENLGKKSPAGRIC